MDIYYVWKLIRFPQIVELICYTKITSYFCQVIMVIMIYIFTL